MTSALLAVSIGSLLLRPLLPDTARIAVVAVVALFIVAGEFGLHRVTLPHRRAQVPTSVIGEGAQRGALRFGYEMGTGMRTHMPSNLPYESLVAVILVAAWPYALVAGLGFGLGRAWMALGRHYTHSADTWDAQWTSHNVWLRRVLTVTLTALLAVLLVQTMAGST